MESAVILFTAVSSLGVFAFRGQTKYYLSLFLHFLLVVTASSWAFRALSSRGVMQFNLFETINLSLSASIDSLSAFFLIIISLTLLTSLLYAHGALKQYRQTRSNRQFSLHHFALLWLHISLLLVCTLRGGTPFLLAWELMTLTVLSLVLFEVGWSKFREVGLSYLVQLQIGSVLIMAGFLLVFLNGRTFGFEGLSPYFLQSAPLPVFLLFFLGFGSYAGFVPFHTWLSPTQRFAPAHVSGILSSVLIPMGFYGILRTLTYIHNDLIVISFLILLVSLLSGIVGISSAYGQQDNSKLLAYSSISSTGITGIGLGVGLLGSAFNIPSLSVLGFTGGILHLFHYALAKPLLSYSLGSIQQATKTREFGQLSGLFNTMPKTSVSFLLGLVALSSLPPLSGFVSQLIIYMGLFDGLGAESGFWNYLLWAIMAGLAFLNGYTLLAYRKPLEILFPNAKHPAGSLPNTEVSDDMIMAKGVLGSCVLATGLFPLFFIKLVSHVTVLYTPNLQPLEAFYSNIVYAGLIGTFLIGLVLFTWWLHSRPSRPVNVRYHRPSSFDKSKREHWIG
ncbi:hypothetical protein GCM10027347_45450 [Larkinella harenae]